MIPTVTALDLPGVLGDFHRAHPEVSISLRGGTSDELVAAVDAGELDVAVLGLPESSPPRRVRSRVLARARHVAVLASGHALAGRARLALADLATETFTDFPAGSPGRAQSDLAFQSAGLPREVVFEVTSPELICALVEQQLAIALLPPAVVPERPGLVTVPVADGPTRVEHLAWSAFNPSPVAEAFLHLLGDDQRR